MKNIILTALFCCLFTSVNSQDFFRLEIVHDFKKNKLVNNFSFDFNRTEKVDEKAGKFIRFKEDNIYLLPSSEINLGDGVTSSENNVLAQLNAGKAWYGRTRQSGQKTYAWNKAFEINPSYNSDKSFNERLYYAQIKYVWNFILSLEASIGGNIYTESESSLSLGIVSNLGNRTSKNFNDSSFYSTQGILLEFKKRILDSSNNETWAMKLSGNYYRISSDIEQLTDDDYAGIIKASMSTRLYKNMYVGISYKYGNDNPNYNYVHVSGVSMKIKY